MCWTRATLDMSLPKVLKEFSNKPCSWGLTTSNFSCAFTASAHASRSSHKAFTKSLESLESMLVEFRGVLGSSTLPDNIEGEIGSTRGAVKSSGFCFAFARSGVAVKISTENECLGLRKTCSALDWSLECISPSGPSSGTPSKLSDMEIPRLCLPSKSPRTEEFFF